MWSYGGLLAVKPRELLLASLPTLRLKPTGIALLDFRQLDLWVFLVAPF